jgi:hypothetical protein
MIGLLCFVLAVLTSGLGRSSCLKLGQLRRFHHIINLDEVFGTQTGWISPHLKSWLRSEPLPLIRSTHAAASSAGPPPLPDLLRRIFPQAMLAAHRHLTLVRPGTAEVAEHSEDDRTGITD